MIPFDIFMIDPPWQKRKGGLRRVRPRQGRSLSYKTMSVKGIFELLDREIFNISANDHCVFIWTIEQFLSDCEQAMAERGYRRHCRFIWDKTNGVAPCFTIRYAHEYLIWYYKVKLLAVAKASRGVFKTVFIEKARAHSRKPDFPYHMIEMLYPTQTKIDVFSREVRPGWAQFGDQTDYFKTQSHEKIPVHNF